MSFSVRRFEDPRAFRRRAEPWLLRREAEHNLLLGLLRTLETSPDLFEPPIYLASCERDDEMEGCAFRTPPFKLGLTRLPEAALPPLASDVAAVYEKLPAVLGPSLEARAFAELWARRTGCEPREGMRQRIFRLERVIDPAQPAPGRLRLAGPGDLELVTGWMEAFQEEAGVARMDAGRLARERIGRGAMFLWEAEAPVSMAGHAGETPNGARVGPVYTPPPLRGRGYATALVAALSRRTLEAGKRFCFLYTDLANPTSNRIYERIGYEPVADVIDVHLDEETNG